MPILNEKKYMKKNIDLEYWKKDKRVAGIDEAGRGPLAGPVAVAAVILPPFCDIKGIDDSKKVREKDREELAILIKQQALSYSIVMISHEEIDKINILRATLKGMQDAFKELSSDADMVLIDGRDFPLEGVAGKAVIKGDQISMSIAAASILAKVERDNLMCREDQIYPQYGFAKHKGYGTLEHRKAILKSGPCPIHRRSFLKKILSEK